jgi:hypothetical protein
VTGQRPGVGSLTVPDGGGWRPHGRAQGEVNRPAHRDPGRSRKVHRRPNIGYCYVHSAVDGFSRPAYSEALDDATAATALACWARARDFFAGHGIVASGCYGPPCEAGCTTTTAIDPTPHWAISHP